ncbi:retrovirus-related pol polyprotein from transposon TNT 1-94, partial [Trifolium medium]|nr:retrovirus-related pol polyprotein from transposon TNT 1-94 [Trifolium medium]
NTVFRPQSVTRHSLQARFRVLAQFAGIVSCLGLQSCAHCVFDASLLRQQLASRALMTGDGGFSKNILVLDSKNWDRWSALMKSLFGAQEQNVDSQHFEKIAKATKSKEAWDILENYHDGGAKVKKVKLQAYRRQYESLVMEEDQKVSDYFSKLLALVNQMQNCGETISYEMVVEKVLRSLTLSFDYIVVAIEYSKDTTTMKIEELQSALEAHEIKMLSRGSERVNQQALQAQLGKKDDGHFADECWYKKDQQEANVAEENDAKAVLMMATIGDESEKNEEWFLDSGCSNHMTPHREWLTSFDASKKTSIKLADSSKLAAEGTGKIVFKGKTGNTVIIEDVFYVPKMNCNLMSIGQLVQKGFSVTIEGNSLNLFDAKKNLVLKSALSKNRTYRCKISSDNVMCLSATMSEQVEEMWHK